MKKAKRPEIPAMILPLTPDDLDEMFGTSQPAQFEIEHFEDIRVAGRALAEQIILHTPASLDQIAALRKVREALYTARDAVRLGGKY